MSLWIGYDIGSSFIKVSLVDSKGNQISTLKYPNHQMQVTSNQKGWAEQHPQIWWKYVCQATNQLIAQYHCAEAIKGIGISYQMHGLVLVDQNYQVIRPSIIWSDSRSVQVGQTLTNQFQQYNIAQSVLNEVGNLTMSKLKWVQIHQPQIFSKIYKFMLPGDYIALKLTGQCTISQSGLSQGIMWDFTNQTVSQQAFKISQIPIHLIPKIVKNFQNQGTVTEQASKLTKLPFGIPVWYRAGDQTNNAYTLNVFNSGEVAATGGTSGVIYAVTNNNQLVSHQKGKINTFLHPIPNGDYKLGKLICINACGSMYSWIRKQFFPSQTYDSLNQHCQNISIGSDGVIVIPFGNGKERILGNKETACSILNLQFTKHTSKHLVRAVIQALSFSFVYGMYLMRSQNIQIHKIIAGNDNLFKCSTLCQIISTLMDCQVQVVEVTGSVGAARLAYLSSSLEAKPSKIYFQNKIVKVFKPQKEKLLQYQKVYENWVHQLKKCLQQKHDKGQ